MTRQQKIALLKQLQAGNKSATRQLVPEPVKVYMQDHQGNYTVNDKPISQERYDIETRDAVVVDFSKAE